MVVGLRFLLSFSLQWRYGVGFCSGSVLVWIGDREFFFFFLVGVLDFCGFWFVFLVLGLLWGGRWRTVTKSHREEM